MILYDESAWKSPYVFSAFVALTEKGIPFETRTLNLAAGDAKTPEYEALTLTARVPALDHDGFVLSESSAIIEYLDDAFPAPRWPRLLPEDPKARARARQFMAWIRSDLMPLREERSTDTMFFERAKRPLSLAAQASADKLLRVTDALVPEGAEGAEGAVSLFGAWSIADADLGFILHRLILNGDPVPNKARKYAEAQWQRPSVRSYVEHDRPRP